MNTKTIILLTLALLVMGGVIGFLGVNNSKKQSKLEEIKLQYKKAKQISDNNVQEKISSIQEKWDEKIKRLKEAKELRMQETIESLKADYEFTRKMILKLGKTPLLDALCEQYGDVKRFNQGKYVVNQGMWHSFSYANGEVIFIFHNTGNKESAMDVSVRFFNEYGMETGYAKYEMSRSIRSAFGFLKTDKGRQTVRAVKCHMYLGAPKYFVVSCKEVHSY